MLTWVPSSGAEAGITMGVAAQRAVRRRKTVLPGQGRRG